MMYGSHPPSHKGEDPKGKPSLSSSRCRSGQGDKLTYSSYHDKEISIKRSFGAFPKSYSNYAR
jgi:hypothetical protein